MRFYAITGRFSLPGEHVAGTLSGEEDERLLALVRGWATGGVDWVQLREKDLPPDRLLPLARKVQAAVAGTRTRLLLNGPAQVAIAAGAAGLHLSGSWTVQTVMEARAAFSASGLRPLLSVSCHSPEQARLARVAGADLALFAPVFGKALPGAEAPLPGQGLEALAATCRAAAPIPVFALGGVNAENAADCLRAGASGIAAIRLFLGDRWRRLADVE